MQRQGEFYEYLTTTHMFCIFILILDLILNNKLSDPNELIYPAINIRFIILFGFMGFIVVLLYNANTHLRRINLRYSWLDLAYVAFPLFVTMLTLLLFKDNFFSSRVVLFLPVLFASSVMGKTAGFAMSTICAMFMVFYQVLGEAKPIIQALESELIIICMMYVMAWFTGGLTETGAKHRKQLNINLQNLKKEIASREKVQEQLRKLSSALEQSPSIVVIADTEGNIEYVNQKFTQVTGYLPEEIIGEKMFEMQGGHFYEMRAQIWDMVCSGKEWRKELLCKKKNGESYWEQMSISPFRNNDGVVTHLLKVAEDITACKNIEKEMARLERLNLIGEMAAGFGHEVRNPMTTVRGFLQLLGEKEEYRSHREYFDLMIEELDRANSIITEYLTMAKNRAVEKKVQNLSTIIKTMAPLIEADAIKSNNGIRMELDETPDLLLDEKEIRQLILNLVRNGLEAMSPGGILTIRTFTEGGEVVLSVQDQGRGIAPHVLEKIGTPFFTTKDNGTGLGLAVCYSIAARHNATIKVETDSTGTIFFVRFKLSDVQGISDFIHSTTPIYP